MARYVCGMNKNLAIFAVIIIFAFAGIYFFLPRHNAEGSLDGFAQCLRNKGATMYEADWCPHCQNEKNAFGESFRFIPYVECPKDPKKCLDAGVRGFPTWIFPDGSKLEGEQGIEKLSRKSGCSINQ